ncbi:MAG: hypothetical protein ACUVTU_09345 [Desulfurispora sp.]|uniref:hypothetical protein n=1 Tax=Desulfurispora sp. TaxID=3014275 RepID=UPI00404AE7F8
MSGFLSNLLSKFKKNSPAAQAEPTAKAAARRAEKESRPRRQPGHSAPACQKIVSALDELAASNQVLNLHKKDVGGTVSYYIGERKILYIIKDLEPPRTVFLFSRADSLAREMGARGLKALSRNEAKSRGYGSAKAVYTGTDAAVVVQMVQSLRQ